VNVLASSLVAASAIVALFLGVTHLRYTFSGTKLHPRDPDFTAAMKEALPNITRRTTMRKCWIGFNASHSFGLILFAAAYGYLAVMHGAFLFRSPFLLGLGLLFLAGYAALSKLYWFRSAFRGVALATALYLSGLVAAFV
jgi:hypothetical protein